jgi:chemotaxis protein CheC
MTVELAHNDPPLQLSELQLDALAEAFNLSLGEAAEVFSQLISEEVVLSVPVVELIDRADLSVKLAPLQNARGNDRVCGITQQFVGGNGFQTSTVLLFPEGGSLEIVRRMLGDETSAESITELEQDALAEVGNIIINGCMSSLANLFHRELLGTIPEVQVSSGEALVSTHCRTERVLLARVGMHLSRRDVHGFVLFMMDTASILSFVGDVETAFQLSS